MAEREERWVFSGETAQLRQAVEQVRALEASLGSSTASAIAAVNTRVQQTRTSLQELSAALASAQAGATQGLPLSAGLSNVGYNAALNRFTSTQSGQMVGSADIEAQLRATLESWQRGIGTTPAPAPTAQGQVAEAAGLGAANLSAQADSMDLLTRAQERLAASTLALERAKEQYGRTTEQLDARETRLTQSMETADAAGKSTAAAEEGLNRVADARAVALARLTAAQQAYVLSLNAVRRAETESAAATTAPAAPSMAGFGETASSGFIAVQSRIDAISAQMTAAPDRFGPAWNEKLATIQGALDKVRVGIAETAATLEGRGAGIEQIAAATTEVENTVVGLLRLSEQLNSAMAQEESTARRLVQAEADRAAQVAETARQEAAAAAALADMRATQAARAASADQGASSAAPVTPADTGAVQGFSLSIEELRGRLDALIGQERELTAVQSAYTAAARAGATVSPIDPELPARLALVRNEIYETRAAIEAMGSTSRAAGEGISYMAGHLRNLLVNQAVYAGLNLVTEGLHGLVDTVVTGTTEAQQAILIYQVRLRDATGAQQRYNDVMKEGQAVGIPDKELLQLDEDLARLGVTSDDAQQRFGRSIQSVRRDLEDLSLVPNISTSEVTELFNRSSEGAQRLAATLQNMGIASRPELEALGVEFAGLSNQIVSDGDTVARAILSIIEQKFGGLAESEANTLTGMETRLGNTMQRLGAIAGQEVFAKTKDNLNALEQVMASPAWDADAKHVGDAIGQITEAGAQAATTLTQLIAIQQFVQDKMAHIGPQTPQFFTNDLQGALDMVQTLGDVLGGNATPRVAELAIKWQLLTDQLGGNTAAATADQAALDRLTAQTQDAAAGQSALAAATDAATAAQDRQRATVDALQVQANRARSAMQDLKNAEQAQEAPIQDRLDQLNAANKAGMRQLDSVAQDLNNQMGTLRDKASSAAQGFSDALAPLQVRLRDLARAQDDVRTKYDAEIQPLKDQESELDQIYQKTQAQQRLGNLDKNIARDRALAVDIYSSQGQEAAIRLQDELAQRQQQLAEQQHTDAKTDLEARISGKERERDTQLAGMTQQQRQLQDAMQQEQDNAAQVARHYQDAESTLQKQVDRVAAIRQNVQNVYNDQQDALQAQITATRKLYEGIESGFTRAQDLIQRAITAETDGFANSLIVTQQNAATVLHSIQTIINGITDTAGYAFPVPRGNADAGGGFGPPVNGPADAGGSFGPAPATTQPGYAPAHPPGRASGGSVSAGEFYEVNEPHGSGREYFRPNVPGTILPMFPGGGGAGGGGGQVQVTLGGSFTITLLDSEGRMIVKRALQSDPNMVVEALTNATGPY